MLRHHCSEYARRDKRKSRESRPGDETRITPTGGRIPGHEVKDLKWVVGGDSSSQLCVSVSVCVCVSACASVNIITRKQKKFKNLGSPSVT